ncbi:MAG: hypothetical protein JXA74_17915 [Anaerolineae bacterium]|nr:hypothetical protein [Anaerolineae bacterium]
MSRRRLSTLIPPALVLVAVIAVIVLGEPPTPSQAAAPLATAYCSDQQGVYADLEFGEPIQRSITLSCAPAGSKTTRVEVQLNVRHECSPDLNVHLDNSHRSVWLQERSCPSHSGPTLLEFTVDNAFDGDPVNDTWTLFVADQCPECDGAWSTWSIRVYYETGTPTPTATPRVSPTRTRTPSPSVPPSSRTPTQTRPVYTATPTHTPRPGCDALHADFDASVFCAISVSFADQSIGPPGDPITSWQWDLGDGNTSNLQNPQHTFAEGIWPVTLTVQTQSGCEATVTKHLELFYPAWDLRKELIEPQGPPHVDDALTYRLIFGNPNPYAMHDFYLYDLFDTRYFEFISASPPPDQVKPAYSSSMLVVWESQGSLAPGQQREVLVTLRAKQVVAPPIQEFQCNQAWALFTPFVDDCGYSVYTPACVEIGPRPELPLRIIKSVIDPPGGAASVGDVIEYEIRVQNLGDGPVTFNVEDSFDPLDYSFVSANPWPTVSQDLATSWLLIWENRTLAAGQSLIIRVRLRAERPTQAALNCVTYRIPPVPQIGQPAVVGPKACASVNVHGEGERAFSVTKRFTQPSSKIAHLGDWVAFETRFDYSGSEAASRVDLYDYIQPASVSPFLPLQFGFLWPFQAGDWAKVTAAFKTQDTASPAINTAEWTAQWPDGSSQMKAAKDYIFIVEPGLGQGGLAVRKRLMDPQGDAAVGDVVTFHMDVTNTSGDTLAVVQLTDSYDPLCLEFYAASIPPTSVTPGSLAWSQLGPLAPGDTIGLNVQFRVLAACGIKLNCVKAVGQVPGAPSLVAATCEPVRLVGERPELRIAKQRLSPSPAPLGSLVEYQIEVTNVGSAALSAVPLRDLYDVLHLEFVNATPAPDAVDPQAGALEWVNLGPLLPGQSHLVTVRLRAIKAGAPVRNCAFTEYPQGSTSTLLRDCALVEIIDEGPAIQIEKERISPAPHVPVSPGQTLAFEITVRNVGGPPLHDLVVVDSYDADALAFLNAPGMNTLTPAPGLLEWRIPLLDPGVGKSWTVLFTVKEGWGSTTNCVEVEARDPAGQPVHDEACVPVELVPAEPGIALHKRAADVQSLPTVGSVVRFEVSVQNTGTTPLVQVPLHDVYATSCISLISAVPAPDFHDPAAGELRWDNLGPLMPGDAHLVQLVMRVLAPCWPLENCAESVALDVNDERVAAGECVPLWVRSGPGENPLFIPLAMRP